MYKKIIGMAIAGALSIGVSSTIIADDSLRLKADTLVQTLGFAESSEGIITLQKTMADGYYQVIVEDDPSLVMVVDEQLRYLISEQGMIDVASQVNIFDELKLAQVNAILPLRVELIKRITSMNDQSIIYYPAMGEEKTKLTIFTNPGCPHCQRLHQDLETLQQAGISIQYVMMPPFQPGSDEFTSFFNIISMENGDKKTAYLDQLFKDPLKTVRDFSRKESMVKPSEAAMNRLFTIYQEAEKIGLRGTPFIIASSGESVAGYPNAEVLIDWSNEIHQ